ncbi:LamG domain-containing protein [Streptomyces sp. NPDC006012]|uniref:LamG domain-containing protein n=1 Tax=Streptomyces sp. NPDC006012 TaxID=3364739 RepID=UPI0036AC3F01
MVRAKDSLNRWSGNSYFDFKVAAAQGPTGQWHFAEGPPSTTSADSATVGTRHPATLNGSAGWSNDARRGYLTTGDHSLYLHGDTSYAQTSEPAVNTADSFTVSAWAYLESDTTFGSVMAQGGPGAGLFELYYSKGVNRWMFKWHTSDNVVYASAGDTGKPPLQVWTHLAGVYDADAQTIQLFVNGEAQGDPVTIPAADTPRATTLPLQFGRSSNYAGSAYIDYFTGRLDEFEVWQRALTADEISLDAQLIDPDTKWPSTELVAHYDPSVATGTTVKDITPYQRLPLQLSATGALLDAESGAISLDGASGTATTGSPLVDPSGSFTVSTEAMLDSEAVEGKPVGYTAQVLSQQAADGSVWGFWYQITGIDPDLGTVTAKWYFGRRDADGSVSTSAVSSEDNAETGSPVRLVGVYDASAHVAHLYLNMDEQTKGVSYTPAQTLTDLAVGSALLNATRGNYFPGQIDDVRIWAGAMADGNQIADVILN